MDKNDQFNLVIYKDRLESIAISSDGQTLASGHTNGLVKLWNLPMGQHIRTLHAHENRVTSIAFNLDGQKFITGSYDGTMKIWVKK